MLPLVCRKAPGGAIAAPADQSGRMSARPRRLAPRARVLLPALCWAVSVSAQPRLPAEALPKAPLPPAPGSTELPAGAIIAFMPRFGADYADAAGLERWLAARGFAICDGRNGTPDLRDRMLLGTDAPARTGEALGSRTHDHQVRGDTGAPVRRNRATQTGREQLVQLPDDQHRHPLDLTTSPAEHLPPSLRVLFIMKLP